MRWRRIVGHDGYLVNDGGVHLPTGHRVMPAINSAGQPCIILQWLQGHIDEISPFSSLEVARHVCWEKFDDDFWYVAGTYPKGIHPACVQGRPAYVVFVDGDLEDIYFVPDDGEEKAEGADYGKVWGEIATAIEPLH